MIETTVPALALDPLGGVVPYGRGGGSGHGVICTAI
jgi:hypothetical protein